VIKKLKQNIELDLEVIPNSREFSITVNPWTKALRVKLKEKALKGQANKELVKKMGKLFQTKIKIITGEKSKRKKILLENISKEKITKLLESQT